MCTQARIEASRPESADSCDVVGDHLSTCVDGRQRRAREGSEAFAVARISIASISLKNQVEDRLEKLESACSLVHVDVRSRPAG